MQKNIRQLAAIMFTDMVGYTALMQEDENKAIKNRQRHRDVLKHSIENHHGIILQFYGDGTLSVFGSAIEAIECAVEIQQELQKEPKIPLRIGMHVGDIVYSDDGIYGDAVNVASRIENLSVPGGVLISEKVYDEIKNHTNFSTVPLGEFDLKNVKQPIKLFAVSNEGLQVPSKGEKPVLKTKSAERISEEDQQPILKTKLYIPPLKPDLVQRPPLIGKINDGLNSKLTLISAPAGFGKTTLVSEWISVSDRAAAWLSIDEEHNDPKRFLAYFVKALQTVSGNAGLSIMAAVQAPQMPPVESILTDLINEIAGIEEPFVLVLDDYHTIDSRAVDDLLTFLLEHLPPQMHLIMTTREDPAFPLARLRVRGQMTELRAADLRFTPDEAAEFLNRAMGLNLSSDDVNALENRTEGWIAGLQLAAISMKGTKDTANFIKSFTGSHRFVMDYLVEEVLHLQPQNIQNFLLHTSILDRLCGPLCEALLQIPIGSGQSILESLDQVNMFILPLDDRRQWYRYHHLFAELLRQRLQQSFVSSTRDDVAAISELHTRASAWYEKEGMSMEAIQHAIAAEDFERAADLTERAWPEKDSSFQSDIWLSMAKSIPDEIIRKRPVLSVSYGWAMLDVGGLEEGEIWLDNAERILEEMKDAPGKPDGTAVEPVIVDDEQFRILPVTIAGARAYISQASGDNEATVNYAQTALHLLPEEDSIRRGPAYGLLGCANWAMGHLEEAYQAFDECRNGFLKSGMIQLAISVTIGLAGIRMAQGRLREAKSVFDESLKLADKQDEPVPAVIADMYLGFSLVDCEQGDLESALQNLNKSRELGRQSTLYDWKYRWLITQARVKFIQNDLDGSLEVLNEAERVYFRTPIPNIRPVSALKATIWIKQGRLKEAEKWMQEQKLSAADQLSYLHEFEHISLARFLIAKYKNSNDENYIAEATGLLQRLLKEADRGERLGNIIEILILQALSSEAQGDIESAVKPLRRALSLAEPEDFIQIFVDEGKEMGWLLSHLIDPQIFPDISGKILDAINGMDMESVGNASAPNQPLIEPLSDREIEVLRLIARGCSNLEISEKLFIALTTVKGHNLKIFGKLNVQRRTEAVARARELGIL